MHYATLPYHTKNWYLFLPLRSFSISLSLALSLSLSLSLINIFVKYPRVLSMYDAKLSSLGQQSTQIPSEPVEQTLGRFLRGWCKLIAKDEWPLPLATGSVICLHTDDRLTSDPLAAPPPPSTATTGQQHIQQGATIATKQHPATQETLAQTPLPVQQAAPTTDEMIEGPALLELCTDFSSSVLECLLQFLRDINLFDSPEFRTQLAMLVGYYKVL